MENVPGYFSWFGVEQILWLCSKVINFFYDLIPSVGWAIILFAIFSHILFLPFSLKNRRDEEKGKKIKGRIKELYEEFDLLPEEERNKEEVKEKFRERKKEIEKEKPSSGLGCFIILLRLFITISALPVVNSMEYFIDGPLNYNFLGLNLLEIPMKDLSFSLILPAFTAVILTIPGFLSVRRNLKEREEMNAKKTKEEREEEEQLLKELNLDKKRIPPGYIVQFCCGLLYLYTFSNIKLALSLYWCAYYISNFFVRRLVDFGFSKIVK